MSKKSTQYAIEQMLIFCSDTYKEMSTEDQKELEERLKKYLSENGQEISIKIRDGKICGPQMLPLEGRAVVSSAIVRKVNDRMSRYIKRLLDIVHFMPFFAGLVDYHQRNTAQAKRMFQTLEKLVKGQATNIEVQELSEYVVNLPAENRRLSLHLLCAFVILADICAILYFAFKLWFLA